ncbi:MAG TPA: hypothetical protein VGO48_15920 [Conexibacter sp.]|jgi:hypothetical protein|nr:hypothetical protein [Conexibacter sp.]
MADEGNVTLFKQLYSKLAEALSVGTPNAAPGQNYISLCNPGILLDPRLDLARNVNDQATWSGILDNVPEPNWVYTATNTSIASIYEQILEGKELPSIELTRTQQAQLRAAQEVVMNDRFEPTPRYNAYVRYEAEYQTALTAYATAQVDSANTGRPIPPATLNALNRARANWNTFGFRGQIETARATIANLEALNPNPWWEALRNRFMNAAAGRTFEPSTTYPEYGWFIGEAGWTEFTFTQEDVTRQETSSAVGGGGGVSAGWGLWRVSGSAEYSKETRTSSSDTTGISISMDLMRATIQRPWIDPLVFRAHTWRWGQGAVLHGDQISNGAFVPGEERAGLMPLLPTGVIVARNLVIEGQFSHEDQTIVQEALRTEMSVGWGPFSISGHYNQSRGSAVSHGNVEATGMSNPDPQILGFFCDVLPLCPSPDPSLPWPATV